MQITEKGKYLTRSNEVVIIHTIKNKTGTCVGKFEEDIKKAEDLEMQKYGNVDRFWIAVAKRGTNYTWLQDGRKDELSRDDNEYDIIKKL